ncbi:CPBP family intramembrane glutamic endopeptidase [Mesobacillus persicus]
MLDPFELASLIIGIVIIAPVFEELLFRVPLSIWMNRSYRFFIALFISSILFGLLHAEYPVFGFVLGMIFGVVYKLSKSVVPAIITHFIWNVFSLYYFNYL